MAVITHEDKPFIWYPEYRNLDDSYVIFKKIIGCGEYSVVMSTELYGKPRYSYASKLIRKCKIKGKLRSYLVNECLVLRLATRERCQFICHIYRTFVSDKLVILLLELCQGGELFSLLSQKYRNGMPENFVRFYVACAIKAIEFLHSHHIVYRDLKPENLMIDSDGYVKLVDFGYARWLRKGDGAKSPVGTTEYMPPEIVRHSPCYYFSSDYYQIGTLTYELLCGDTPFVAHGTEGTPPVDTRDTFKRIRQGIDNVTMKPQVGSAAEDFIRGLCKKDPFQRLGTMPVEGFRDILKHPWFEDFDWVSLENKTMKPPFDPEIQGSEDCRYYNPKDFDCNKWTSESTPDYSEFFEVFA